MQTLHQIPDWLGTALVGVLGGTVGWFANFIVSSRQRAKDREDAEARRIADLTGCGNTREIRVFPWSAGVWRTFGVRIYGFLLCCRARIMPRDRLLA